MRIDSIEIYRVDMPLIYPFRTAFGDDDSIESMLVRFKSGDYFGWGESALTLSVSDCQNTFAFFTFLTSLTSFTAFSSSFAFSKSFSLAPFGFAFSFGFTAFL